MNSCHGKLSVGQSSGFVEVDNIYVVNAGTNIPRLAIGDPAGNSSVISDRYVEDGSYFNASAPLMDFCMSTWNS